MPFETFARGQHFVTNSLEGTSRPFVSIIVPAYNEAVHLPECLASLQAQRYPAFEILLVDNASTDDTRALCAQLPYVRYIFVDRCKSSYAARNEGAAHARGDVLVFFDADQTASTDFLTVLLAEFRHDDPDHVYVGRLADDPRVPEVLRRFYSCWGDLNYAQGQIPTAAVGVPKPLFIRLGGFRENLRSGGDFEFFKRAVKTAVVHCTPGPIGAHYWATTLTDHLQREERYRFGRCRLTRESGEPAPDVLSEAMRVIRTILVKLLVSVSIVFRHPMRDWPLLWHAQYVGMLTAFAKLKGVVKFHQGCQDAGDLTAE